MYERTCGPFGLQLADGGGKHDFDLAGIPHGRDAVDCAVDVSAVAVGTPAAEVDGERGDCVVDGDGLSEGKDFIRWEAEGCFGDGCAYARFAKGGFTFEVGKGDVDGWGNACRKGC